MAHFFAAVAANVLDGLVILLAIILVFLILLLGFVLGVLATGLVLGFATAAPPNLARVLAPMNAAAPVEVLLFDVVFATVLASFLLDVELALLLLELLDAVLHLLALSNQILLLFLEGLLGLKGLIGLLSFLLELPVELHQTLLKGIKSLSSLLFKLQLSLQQILRLLPVVVSISGRLLYVLVKDAILLVLLRQIGLVNCDLLHKLVFKILGVGNRLD